MTATETKNFKKAVAEELRDAWCMDSIQADDIIIIEEHEHTVEFTTKQDPNTTWEFFKRK